MANSMFVSCLLVFLLSTASAEAETGQAATARETIYNFDTLHNPVGSGAPLIQIGEYKHLDFALRLGTKHGISPVEGVVPHTSPNYAIFGNESTIVSGPAFINKTSSISSFDLNSFWYGCEVAVATDNINIPENCTINVAGLNAKGKQVASRKLTFTASGGVKSQQQVQAKFTNFKGLSSVTFDYDSADILQTGVIFDSFVATLHS